MEPWRPVLLALAQHARRRELHALRQDQWGERRELRRQRPQREGREHGPALCVDGLLGSHDDEGTKSCRRMRPQGAAQDCWRNRHWQRRSSRLPARGSATRTVGDRGGSPGASQGKAAYCTDCHGPAGQGYRGFYVMPRLAGQSPEYFENQLRAFVAGRRERNSAMVMSKVHGLGPAHAIGIGGAFCRAQPSTLRREAPRELVATGRQIYEEGPARSQRAGLLRLPRSGRQGSRANSSFGGPALRLHRQGAGELGRVSAVRSGATADTSSVMRPVAHSLSKAQIAAVAAYLSYLD